MNCAEWEERIALYCGGDLAPAEARAVEAHLAGCGDCRAFESGLRESLGALHEAHAEPLAEAHFTALRARVLDQLAAGYRPWRRWAWSGAALASAAVVLVLAVLPRRAERQPVPAFVERSAAAVSHAVPAPIAAAAAPVKPGLRRPLIPAKAHLVRSAPAAPPAQPLVVKLVTDDPNVVIYWITAKSGE